MELSAKKSMFLRFSTWKLVKLSPICSKRHLQHDSMALFPLALCTFYNILALLTSTEIRITKGRESDFWLIFFNLIFPLLLLSSFCSSDWPFTGLASSSHFCENALIIETGNFCHGIAKCSHREFHCNFFTQKSGYFHAYLRIHWPNYSRKANVFHGWLRLVMAGAGVSGSKELISDPDSADEFL